MDLQIKTTTQLEQQRFITKVYGWMSVGLTITAIVAAITVSTPIVLDFVYSSMWIFLGLLLLELILVAYLVIMVSKMSSSMATLTFLGYSGLNGLTFSVFFLRYTTESIASTFLITAATFGVMSIYGYFTKTDLTSIGNMALMALTGLIIASFTNLFFFNETVYWITTYAGILIFVVLTAYDTQKIKRTNILGNEGSDIDKKEAIIGALTLYLDFINLFVKLLRIFGKRK